MSEETIFSKNTPQQNTQQGTPQPSSPGSTEIPLNELPHDIKAEGKVVKAEETAAGGQVPPGTPPPPAPFGFSKGLIIKIVLGILGVALVVFLIFGVVIPMFTKGSNTADEKANLIYWGLWESENTMNVIIKEFEKANPNIKVTYIKQDPINYREKVQAQVGKENGPDVFRYHNSWTPMLLDELAPLPVDVISPKNFEATYYPVVSDDLNWNGALYGIPVGMDTLALFINREITRDFDVPRDWEDFAEVAEAVTVKDGEGVIKTAGAALGEMENVTHAPDIISMMMIQSGADLYGTTTSSDKSKAAMASALDYYLSFSSGEGKIWDSTLPASLNAFAAGDLAMYFGYSWDIFQIRALNPELQFEVHPVPSLGQGRDMTVASYWVEGVASQSKQQDAAFKFMKYLSQKSTLQTLYTTTAKTREFGELYPMKSLKNSLQSNTVVYPFLEQAENARSTYFVSDTHDDEGLNGQMINYLRDAFLAITTKNTSSQTAVDTLVKGIQAVRSQYGF